MPSWPGSKQPISCPSLGPGQALEAFGLLSYLTMQQACLLASSGQSLAWATWRWCTTTCHRSCIVGRGFGEGCRGIEVLMSHLKGLHGMPQSISAAGIPKLSNAGSPGHVLGHQVLRRWCCGSRVASAPSCFALGPGRYRRACIRETRPRPAAGGFIYTRGHFLPYGITCGAQ